MRARWFVLVLSLLCPTLGWAADGSAPAPGGYGLLLLKMVFILGGVCLLAWVTLRWGVKRFVSPDRAAGGAMEVLGRLPLEPRRSLLVVRVASRHLVLSSSENGVEPITELTPAEAGAFLGDAEPSGSFAELFRTATASNVSRETSPLEET